MIVNENFQERQNRNHEEENQNNVIDANNAPANGFENADEGIKQRIEKENKPGVGDAVVKNVAASNISGTNEGSGNIAPGEMTGQDAVLRDAEIVRNMEKDSENKEGTPEK